MAEFCKENHLICKSKCSFQPPLAILRWLLISAGPFYRADTERRAEFPDVLLRKPADLLQGGPAKEWYAYPYSLFFLKFYKGNKGKLNFLHGEPEQ